MNTQIRLFNLNIVGSIVSGDYKRFIFVCVASVSGLLLLLTMGCGNDAQAEMALIQLFDEEKELLCDLKAMKQDITAKWDKVNMVLEENLPESMPAAEKANMLKVRNASLIRMFESFEEVSSGIKQLLDETEAYDDEMASKVVTMKKEKQRIEDEKMALFDEIKRTKGKEVYHELQANYLKVIDADCK
ncbi:hypothetical protein FUA23_04740 [Neolewinella aurantiaca]|uniref:Uncharacterized protein n=1 Tax=Neolewinella aurantiaca TaxID=2602767 RepID=A0A5C7FRV8_9BACT|nr:hypothetical protein [Neolewinella aurantiaca]TXF90750.1 hypothetical protein FUA23_04740 [Neolewinella aurantiaca]